MILMNPVIDLKGFQLDMGAKKNSQKGKKILDFAKRVWYTIFIEMRKR